MGKKNRVRGNPRQGTWKATFMCENWKPNGDAYLFAADSWEEALEMIRDECQYLIGINPENRPIWIERIEYGHMIVVFRKAVRKI